ncbi:unnamed protein product [Heterobilharzia americana]|nr:unnamed protein product [Heterobilharzia americana]
MNLYFLSFSRYKANHLISLNVCSMLFPLITFVLICPYLTMEVIRKTPTTKDLIMLFILCRHGDRSPVHTFPVDPYRNVWKMGYGQLTAYGAEQHHELGRLIRKMYSGFLPEIYHKDEVLFRSSGTERTLMSANNFIRGFYQLEKKSTNQLPPVFSRLTHEDHLLKMSSKCPKFKKLFHHLMNSSAVSRKASTFKDFFSYLEQVSGYAFPKEKDSPENFYPAWHICDPITIWVNHAFSSLPQWVTDDVYKKCTSLLDYKHFIRFSRPQLTRLRGGPLAGHLVDLFRERINKEAKQNDNNNAHENPSEKRSRRFVAYFAHDSTLAALLSHLGVYNGLKPPLASCLIVELHRPSLSFKDFHVVFHYLNETKLPFNTEKLINLWPPHCGNSQYN